jgi:hypothetical protein
LRGSNGLRNPVCGVTSKDMNSVIFITQALNASVIVVWP